MKNFYLCALLIIGLVTLFSGCATKNLNNISLNEINTVKDKSKALVLVQTTPITGYSNPSVYNNRIETGWVNISVPNSCLDTQNYKKTCSLDICPERHNDVELYLVTPGTYLLKKIKYFPPGDTFVSLFGLENIANFSINGGEVLYIGNLVANIRDNGFNGDDFLKKGISIGDDYNTAKTYINTFYPFFSDKLQKRLIIIH